MHSSHVMQTTKLDNLPLEILEMIVGNVPKQGDLGALSRVSKYLRRVVVPGLYEVITLKADHYLLDPVALSSLLGPSKKYLEFVRGIAFEGPYAPALRSRLPQRQTCEGIQTPMDRWKMGKARFHKLDADLATLLQSLQRNRLRELSWHVGASIPDALGGLEGGLILQQTNVQSVSLDTHGSHHYGPYSGPLPGLSLLKRLKSLSWRCSPTIRDLETLQESVDSNRMSLQQLTVHFCSWPRVDGTWYGKFRQPHPARIPSVNYIATDIVGVKPGESRVVFPSLRHLSLQLIPFTSMAKELLLAFNIGALRSLKLRNCPGTHDLSRLIDHGQVIALESFEYCLDPVHHRFADMDYFDVDSFLLQFRGLKDLCLLLSDHTKWDSMYESICNHAESLRRLVIHSRRTEALSHNGCRYHDSNLLWDPKVEKIFAGPELKLLGLSIDRKTTEIVSLNSEILNYANAMPPIQASQLREVIVKSTIEVLHLRETLSSGHGRPNLNGRRPQSFQNFPPGTAETALGTTSWSPRTLQIAQWAFGPEGPPKLRILAMSNVPPGADNLTQNLVLCRKVQTSFQRADSSQQPSGSDCVNFRCVTEADRSLQELLRNNMDMLMACTMNGSRV